ncbi:MAG: nuclear transport factor 2 family protein [Candidatus Devosia symbiotica]|nr:nuclear transport factor 2 family protein [Candidatus Devosia symbiotica]
MIINDPTIVAEVQEIFERYERALLANDSATLDAMFVAAPETVRYGVKEIQYGIDEIRAFRSIQQPFSRTLDRLVIASYGADTATAPTLFTNPISLGKSGGRCRHRSSRMIAGVWPVAHVSMMAIPA